MSLNLSEEIKKVLGYFGPCTVRTIQEKLFLRDIDVSHIEILNTCEMMLRFKEVKEAKGYHGRAFEL